jgi:hypothetical protein
VDQCMHFLVLPPLISGGSKSTPFNLILVSLLKIVLTAIGRVASRNIRPSPGASTVLMLLLQLVPGSSGEQQKRLAVRRGAGTNPAAYSSSSYYFPGRRLHEVHLLARRAKQ